MPAINTGTQPHEEGYTPRKRGLARRDLFLDEAAAAFTDKGFEATSLQDIVAKTGGSLSTLYRMFGNKEGLFQAVLERKFERVFGEVIIPEMGDREPEQVLFEVGSGLLKMIMSDEAINIHRLMMVEAKRMPTLRDIFMEIAPNKAKAALATYFREQNKAGVLNVDDCELAASQYLEMIKGDIYMRKLLGENVKLTKKQQEFYVMNAVTIFLNGVKSR